MENPSRREYQFQITPAQTVGKISLAGALGAGIGFGLAELNHFMGSPVDLEVSRQAGDALVALTGGLTGGIAKGSAIWVRSVNELRRRGYQA